jgi:GT2 family glycosyltransferase/glycosyltransferase involved in cell wall biosynthesis
MFAVNADPERLSPVAVVPARSPVVDVIIPVYAGMEETRRCLESVLTFPQRTAHEIVVIDDCGPEPAISAWLDGLADSGAITLLKNPINMGFVNAVNRGMVLHPDRDVVLLNSDAEVHGDWLDRLHRHAANDPMVGSVTPFSNNATICSYPRFMQDNPLPEDWPLAALDDLFAEANAGRSVEIPTAVGFCMYITRRCLEQVGYFDAVAFKRGYGEENDFSMRAREVGFRHLLAADVFVYHRGGVSFGAESQPLCAEAQRTLEQRHPLYAPLVSDFCARDPARMLRRRIDSARLTRSSKLRLLFIMHREGGGTEKHVRELAVLLELAYEVFILRPTYDPATVILEWARRGEEFSAWFRLPYTCPDLLIFLRKLAVARIHIHHVLDLPQQLLRLPEELGVPYDFTLHDYYPICPQYNLARADGRYCGEPDTAGCIACLAERPAPWGLDIISWRTLFKNIMAGADRVFVPSRDALSRVKAYIPQANYIHLPHPESINFIPVAFNPFSKKELKVVALGQLSLAKGVKLLESCAIDAKARKLPIYFKVIGFTEEKVKEYPEIPLSFLGRYDDSQLSTLIALERPDLLFFPALWPETYSYTLSYAINSGLPIVGPYLGVFIERLFDYPSAWLLKWDTSAEEWNNFFISLFNKLNEKCRSVVSD